MSKSRERLTCQHPDRDCPGLICGYPLPCPFHTVIIDITKDEVEIRVPRNKSISLKNHHRLKVIGKIIQDYNKDKL